MTSKKLYLLLVAAITLGGCPTSHIPAEIKAQMATSEAIIAYFHPAPPDTQNEDEDEDDNEDPYTTSRLYTPVPVNPGDDPKMAGRLYSTKPAEKEEDEDGYTGLLYSPTPVEDGYYRVLLGRDAKGMFLVQDFYQENKRPQSSPFWIKNPQYAYSFATEAVIGTFTLYYPDGKIMGKLNNIDENNREGKLFYPSGEPAMAYIEADLGTSHYQYWYKSGKLAIEHIEHHHANRPSELTGWDEAGNTVSSDKLLTILTDINALIDPRSSSRKAMSTLPKQK